MQVNNDSVPEMLYIGYDIRLGRFKWVQSGNVKM